MSVSSYPLLIFPIFPLNSYFFVHKICTIIYCSVPYQSDFLFFTEFSSSAGSCGTVYHGLWYGSVCSLFSSFS